MSSLAMVLSHLMMPGDMMYQLPSGGHPRGNWATCNIQGFTFRFGTMITFCCDAVLCIYYLCSIKYGMNDRKFSSRIEPFFYLVMIVAALYINLQDLLQGYINPSPARAWCARSTYPHDCEREEDCIRGGGILNEKMQFSSIAYFILVIVQVSSMIFIVLHVYFKERSQNQEYKKRTKPISVPIQKKRGKGQCQETEEHSCIAEKSFGKSDADDKSFSRNIYGDHRLFIKNTVLKRGADKAKRPQHESFAATRVIVKQALAYTTLFLVMLPLLFLTGSTQLLNTSLAFGVIHAIIRPSHGTFNMMIFVYHKCYNLRRISSELSYTDAFREVLRGGAPDQEFIFSSLDIVRQGADQSVDAIPIELY